MIFKAGHTYYHKILDAYFYVDSMELYDREVRVFVKEPDLTGWRVVSVDLVVNALSAGYKRHKGNGIKKLSRMFSET